MVIGIVIPAGTDEPLHLLDTQMPDAVAEAVSGLVETVDLNGLGVTVCVNEAGLLNGLPLNSRASFLWWYHNPAARQRRILVGDVVIMGLPDEHGADTEVPLAARELLLSPARYRVEVRATDSATRYRNQETYPDYWGAIGRAMLLQGRWTLAQDVRAVRVEPDPSDRISS